MIDLDSSVREILILGASGFVGGRLAERLYLDHHHVARCLVRDYSRAARLARLPVNMVHGDVLRPEEYERQIADCDVYIYCIHGKDKDIRISRAVDLKGLSNVLQQAVRHKVRHFIFMSSSAIYEDHLDEGCIDETTPIRTPKRGYAKGKWEGEQLCQEYQRRYGLPITILRPTVIYGPFAPSWTVYPAEMVRANAIKDFGSFTGISNTVFIDDVVDVIITCILNERAFSETFIVTGDEHISWGKFFDAFSQAVQGKPLDKSSIIEYWAKAIPRRILKEALKVGVGLMPQLAKKVYGHIRSRRSGEPNWVRGLDVSSLRMSYYRKGLRYSNKRMKEVLGFSPKYDFQAGMTLTSAWLRHHRYTIA